MAINLDPLMIVKSVLKRCCRDERWDGTLVTNARGPILLEKGPLGLEPAITAYTKSFYCVCFKTEKCTFGYRVSGRFRYSSRNSTLVACKDIKCVNPTISQ